MDDAGTAVPVAALLFDLGGVVIEIDFGRCLARWAASAGRDADDLAARFSFDTNYEKHERGLSNATEYFATLRNSLAADLSDEELLAGWTDIYVGVVAGIEPLLSAASARLPLYAFTNSNPSHHAVWSQRFAKDFEVFKTTFLSSDLGVRKPDREAFDAVVAAIGVPAGNILFFDDSIENVNGARDAGIRAVHVTSVDSVRAALADLGIELPPPVPAARC